MIPSYKYHSFAQKEAVLNMPATQARNEAAANWSVTRTGRPMVQGFSILRSIQNTAHTIMIV